jgi:hypothetical protein
MSWNGAKIEPRKGVGNHDINAVKFWKSDYLDVQLHCKLNFSAVLHSVLCVTYVHWQDFSEDFFF